MRRVLATFVSVVLLAWIAFHVMVIASLVQSEVTTALAAGSFHIQTNSMILNRVWEGNELYWLLAAHATLVLVLAVALMRSARFAIRGGRAQKAAAKKWLRHTVTTSLERATTDPSFEREAEAVLLELSEIDCNSVQSRRGRSIVRVLSGPRLA